MGYVIDAKDRQILDVLKDHADYSTRQIAKKTLLPITTIHHRIQKLKKEKVIRAFTIDLDPSAVGKGFMAYVLVSVNLPYLKKKIKKHSMILLSSFAGFRLLSGQILFPEELTL